MGKLKLHWQSDGPRYYLDGEPVHAGAALHAQKADGTWATVRFEFRWDPKENTVKPFLILPQNHGSTELVDTESECRWPH